MKRNSDQSAVRRTLLLFSVALLGGTAALAQTGQAPPLSIARQGYFFVGGKYSTVDGRQVMSGQLYAEFQIPSRQTHPYPIVLIHGGGQTGTNFTGTPDGREGWAQAFLRAGYAVYVVDQVGRGRAPYQPELYGPQRQPDVERRVQRFTAPERYNLWPQARLHTQWPGEGKPGDPIFDQFYASQVTDIQDFTLQQTLNPEAIVELLEKTGPSIVLTHSQSGTFGWPVIDARPDLMKALLSIEPNGPPFYDVDHRGAPDWFGNGPKTRPWGLSAAKLAYSPAAASVDELAIVQQDKPDQPDLARCWMQKEPARKLPNIQKVPHLIVTGEASYHASYDHCTVKYLEQAGVHPTWIKLGDAGVHGNGHMMMIEKNNQEIAAVILRWLEKTMPK